jgi:parallel beta-helix repeat protein
MRRIIALWLMISLLLFSLIITPVTFASTPDSVAPSTRENGINLTISGHEQFIDETRILDSSIEILSGGRLDIVNSTILMSSSAAPVVILVDLGGVLFINDSDISGFDNSNDLGYKFIVYGEMYINNSKFISMGYQAFVTEVESCSGTVYEDVYTSGFEIYSDSVTFYNSNFKFAQNTSIYFESVSSELEGNVFESNIKSIFAWKANLELKDNEFKDNLFAIQVVESDLFLDTCSFHDNLEFNIYAEKTNVTLKNSTINSSFALIYITSGKVVIDDCLIYQTGLFSLEDTDMVLKNSIIEECEVGLSLYLSKGKIRNNIIKNCSYGLGLIICQNTLIENNVFENCSRSNIGITSSDGVQIKNNSLFGATTGIESEESSVDIINNTISGAWLAGIGCYESVGTYKNNLIYDNLIGIGIYTPFVDYLRTSPLIIINNTIVENKIGISSYSSEPQIRGNIIAENLDWGINITNRDPELSGNIFSNEQYSPNGLGRIIRYSDILVDLYDQYNNNIDDAQLTVADENKVVVLTKRSDLENVFSVPIFKILNSGIKQEFNPYTVSGSWGNDNIGYAITNESIVANGRSKVNLTLNLPDIFIQPSDIEISDTSPKHGDKIEFKLTFHFPPSDLGIKDVNVTLTADGGIIHRLSLSFNSSNLEQNLTVTVPWKVVAFESGKMAIRVTIDPMNPYEDRFLGYDDNNIAIKSIDVKGKPQETTGLSLDARQLIGLIMIVLAFLILLFLGISALAKSKAKSDLLKENGELLKGKEKDEEDSTEPSAKDQPGEKEVKEGDEGFEVDKEDEEGKGVEDKEEDMEDEDIKEDIKEDIEEDEDTEGKKKEPDEDKIGKKDKHSKSEGKKTNAKEKIGGKKSMKEKLVEDLNKDLPPRIKW